MCDIKWRGFQNEKQATSKAAEDDIVKSESEKLPKTEDEWLAIARQYENRWNFPNCLGAIGCKHLAVHYLMNPSTTDLPNSKGDWSCSLRSTPTTVSHSCTSEAKIGRTISEHSVTHPGVLISKTVKRNFPLIDRSMHRIKHYRTCS